jgi:hypothetical protein
MLNTTILNTNRIIHYKLCIDSFQNTRELELITKTLILNSSFEGTMNEIIRHIFKKEGINNINSMDTARLCYIDESEQYDLNNTTNTTNTIIIDCNEIDEDLNDVISENTFIQNNIISSEFIVSNNGPQYSLLSSNIKNQIKNCEIICVVDFNNYYDDNYTAFYKRRFNNLEEFEQQFNDFMSETINTINSQRHVSSPITKYYLTPHIVAVKSGFGWIKLD